MKMAKSNKVFVLQRLFLSMEMRRRAAQDQLCTIRGARGGIRCEVFGVEEMPCSHCRD